jgi:hypothetical protein
VEDWAVRCVCGVRDDDGERMIVCDGCGFWLHTRCNGVADEAEEPGPGFMCVSCRAEQAREGEEETGGLSGHGAATSVPGSKREHAL